MALGTGTLIIFAICSLVTVLALLRTLTNIIEHETDLHDLRIRLKEVQYERELQSAQMLGLIPTPSEHGDGKFEDVGDEPEMGDADRAIARAQDAAEQVAAGLDEMSSADPETETAEAA